MHAGSTPARSVSACETTTSLRIPPATSSRANACSRQHARLRARPASRCAFANSRPSVAFTISGGTGDADLYTRIGTKPTTLTYNCRPYLTGNNETCTFNAPAAGDYYVMIRGYTAFTGVTLKGQYS